MKAIFNLLQIVISILAIILFLAGIVITVLGGYEFVHAFGHFSSGGDHMAGAMAIEILQSVDLFLIAVVLYVFSLGLLILFNNKPEQVLTVNLPNWLRVENFMQLKVILWEAILTTLVISHLAGIARIRMAGGTLSEKSLIVPASILLIALALYFLKKGETHTADHAGKTD